MEVEQAIYGEVRGGHALRLASGRNRVPAELASRLDLPDTAPPGVNWSPFVSGFAHGDSYVLARTFADPAATRAGMVLSHALLAPLKELIEVADLRPLLALLIAAPVQPHHLETRRVARSVEPPPGSPDLAATAEALTSRGNGPVVRVGLAGFEDLVAALWFRLWPELRAQFAFRLSFGPHDVVEAPGPSIVCTPTALATRWAGYRLVGPAGPAAMSRAAAILSGEAEAEPILRFARQVGASIHRLPDLTLLQRAYEIGSAPDPSFEECVAALRLVERLSQDPSVGSSGKARLIERAATRLHDAGVTDVLLLRNLSTTGLPAANTLWSSLTLWAAANKFNESDDTDMLSAIADALSASSAVDAWRNAIVGGIVDAARSGPSPFPSAFWRWAHTDSSVLAGLGLHLPHDHGLEVRLSEAAPSSVSPGAGEAVMSLAVSKKWFRLHGAAARAALVPEEAIRRQLSVDTNPKSLDGLRAILERTAPAKSLAIALQIAEPRVMRIVAEAVARDVRLLQAVDFREGSAQEIWAHALSLNHETWRGPADPQRAFENVIENLLDGGTANPELIASLSATPLADLSGYPRHAEVWPRVSQHVRANLLKATATGWLQRASRDEFNFALDPQLEASILAGDTLEQVLRALGPTGTCTAVRIFATLRTVSELRFLRWLESWIPHRRISASEAEALGHLILDRRWNRAVDSLVDLARKGRHDVKQALHVCHDLVGIFARWQLGLARVTYEDKWQILEELVTDLYPMGPDHDALWSRAGGQDADLRASGSGRSRWRDAIAQIRQGRGPRPKRLLDEIKKDFPSNDQVSALARDPELGL